MTQKPGKGDALRKEKALLHTFVAGQKYGVGRDDPPVLSFKITTRATDKPSVAQLYKHST
jgi:hypothetical protein